MPGKKTDIQLTAAEKQILEHPFTLRLFLFALVPSIAGFNIYVMMSGRVLASAVLCLQLAGFTVAMVVMRSGLPDIKKILAYRHIFRFQIIAFGIYMLVVVGFLNQVEVTPWSFLFIFLVSIWMPDKEGLWVTVLFNVSLIFMGVVVNQDFFLENQEYLVRFYFAMAAFSFVALSSGIVRHRYLARLYAAGNQIEADEKRYRALARELAQKIQERDEIEKRLHHAIKMETVGRVAAGVAHDLNNTLSGIVTYPDLMLLDMPADHPLRPYMEMIRDSGVKAAAMVDDLLTLSRRGVTVSRPVDLCQAVAAYLSSPEFRNLRERHKGVKIEQRYGQGVGPVLGSPVHLSKVLMNLVSNAVESIPGSGEVTVTVKRETLVRPRPLAHPVQGRQEIPQGTYTLVEIVDTGIGIEAEAVDAIFEPFYTKKPMGSSGTGLGMAIVLNTVNDHGGWIDLDTAPGRGTAVAVYFPVTTIPMDPEAAGQKIALAEGCGKRILVVDDTPDQRVIAKNLLERLGYHVQCCDSGEGCLEAVLNQEVDLVVLDIMMSPGMDGVATGEAILKQRPDQKILFVTGYSHSGILDRARAISQGPCLLKPYTLEKIAALVKARLDA